MATGKKITFTATILKFAKKGEKTGWTYIEIPAGIAQKLKPGNKKSFRIKGKLDHHTIVKSSLLPMGDGNFILPLNARVRKAIGKKHGAMLNAELQEDKSEYVLNPEMMMCLADEPEALKNFKKLPGSHQRYFSGWIENAKTGATRAKRIAQTVNALARGWGFSEMMRVAKKAL